MNSSVLRKLNIHTSWDNLFISNSEILQEIIDYLDNMKNVYYPEKKNIFKMFNRDLNEIQIVMMGQDPYPQGIANGIAFSVNKGQTSSSLEIIKEELMNYTFDILIDSSFDPTLELWIDQGIFLLNAALTVRAFNSGSHLKLWEPFMSQVVSYINDNTENIIFVFMGNPAKRFSALVNKAKHSVILSPHPNVDYHVKSKKQFVGSNIFENIDEILFNINKTKIKWV